MRCWDYLSYWLGEGVSPPVAGLVLSLLDPVLFLLDFGFFFAPDLCDL